MTIGKLAVTSIWLLILANSAPAQTPYQLVVGALKIYSVGDLAFGVQEKPGISLACVQSTGKFLLGSTDQTRSVSDQFTVTSGDGRPWVRPVNHPLLDQRIDGRYNATVGSSSVEVFAEHGTIRFAQPITVLEAVRLNSDVLRISLADTETGEVVVEQSFNTSDVDICRFAFACGDQKHIRAACGSSVWPPSPQIRMLKREIEAVLSKYPTSP